MTAKRRLWTTGDIADRLQVTRQRANQLVNDKRQNFPDPFDTLPGGVQVWLIEDAERWITEHRTDLAEDPES